jgi:hypothetical protein
MMKAGSDLAMIGTSTSPYDHSARSLFLNFPSVHERQSHFFNVAQGVPHKIYSANTRK